MYAFTQNFRTQTPSNIKAQTPFSKNFIDVTIYHNCGIIYIQGAYCKYYYRRTNLIVEHTINNNKWENKKKTRRLLVKHKKQKNAARKSNCWRCLKGITRAWCFFPNPHKQTNERTNKTNKPQREKQKIITPSFSLWCTHLNRWCHAWQTRP